MLKLNSKALENVGEIFYYRGAPYNGFAVFSENGNIAKVSSFENGKQKQSSCDDLLPSPPIGEHIDADLLVSQDDDDAEPYYLNENPFTGVAFVFNDDYVDGIQYLEEGKIAKEVSWYKSGEMATLESNSDGIFQEYWWNQDNSPKKVNISLPEKNQFNLEFNGNGELTGISITDDSIHFLEQHKEKILFPDIIDLNNVLRMPASESITFFGGGVSDRILNHFIEKWSKSSINKISILNTNATLESLRNLKLLPYLREVKLTRDHSRAEEIAIRLHREIDDCSVSII